LALVVDRFGHCGHFMTVVAVFAQSSTSSNRSPQWAYLDVAFSFAHGVIFDYLQTAVFGLPQCCAGSGRVCDFKWLYLSLQEIGWCRVSGDSLLFVFFADGTAWLPLILHTVRLRPTVGI
jgi:hypothetical protein